MPYGAAADLMNNVPGVPFTMTPTLFDQLTSKQHNDPITFPDLTAGTSKVSELLKSGILTWLTVSFDGSMTTDSGSGAVVTAWPWPYGFLQGFQLAANTSAGIFNCDGVDLHVRRFLANPSFVEGTDVYTGTIGGGDTLSDDTYDLHLTWDIPVVADLATLIGCIYAQSNMNALTATIKQAAVDFLFTLTGTASVVFDGSWTIAADTYMIPVHPEQGIVTPDLTRAHLFQEFETSFTATGKNPVWLTQADGQLQRLLVQVRDSATSVLSPLPGNGFDRLQLVYGSNEVPLDYNVPDLVALNNDRYGAPLPYGFVALDFIKENPVRDAVNMPALTELRVVPDLGSGVSVSAGAKIRTVQEMLVKA